MKYRVTSELVVEADTVEEAQREAVQAVAESPDLFHAEQDFMERAFPGYDPARGPLIVGPAPTLGSYESAVDKL